MAKKSSRISSAEKKRLAYALITLVTAAILLIIPRTRNRVLEYLGFFDTDSPQAEIPDGEIAVHFIDVGQGDAELIMTSDGKTVLIDSGTPESRTVLTGYLKEQGVKKKHRIRQPCRKEDSNGQFFFHSTIRPRPWFFIANIAAAAGQNQDFRTAFWTGAHLKMALISIPDRGKIIFPFAPFFLFWFFQPYDIIKL